MSVWKKRSLCPISSALDLIGDKWSLLIIRDLIFNDKHTFGAFLKSDEKIATNILTDRLLLLESHGLIAKKEDPDNGTRYLYHITEKGLDLLPVLTEMILWSDKYLEISDQARAFAAQLRSQK